MRFLLRCLVLWTAASSQWVSAQLERNNWALLVDTSRYWYNYRHVSNVLSFYHTIKRLGIPDSQIILMMAEDAACNPRNSMPGTIFNEPRHDLNLYGEHVEVDYRGDEVSIENFLRLLSGRHSPSTPRSKRLLTDSQSNILIYMSGHSGEEFIKFQDWEELTSNDIADAFQQMYRQQRYRRIFWISDTCQAASLQNQFYTPGIIAIGSSDQKENAYSHHVDPHVGVAVVDRFTYYALDFLKRVTTSSKETVDSFHKNFKPHLLKAHPQVRWDLYGKRPEEVFLVEFLASTSVMHFHNRSWPLAPAPRSAAGAAAMPDLAGSAVCDAQLLATNPTLAATCSASKLGADPTVTAASLARRSAERATSAAMSAPLWPPDGFLPDLLDMAMPSACDTGSSCAGPTMATLVAGSAEGINTWRLNWGNLGPKNSSLGYVLLWLLLFAAVLGTSSVLI